MNEKNNKRTIFGWSMYDWAKSAYETTILGAVLPVYFVSVIVPEEGFEFRGNVYTCLLYTSPSPRDRTRSRMPSSA